MTTPPVEPEPHDDMKDPEPAGSAPTDDEGEASDDSDHTDAMGIDDEDPIDATLVGTPVDEDEPTVVADQNAGDRGSDDDDDGDSAD